MANEGSGYDANEYKRYVEANGGLMHADCLRRFGPLTYGAEEGDDADGRRNWSW